MYDVGHSITPELSTEYSVWLNVRYQCRTFSQDWMLSSNLQFSHWFDKKKIVWCFLPRWTHTSRHSSTMSCIQQTVYFGLCLLNDLFGSNLEPQHDFKKCSNIQKLRDFHLCFRRVPYWNFCGRHILGAVCSRPRAGVSCRTGRIVHPAMAQPCHAYNSITILGLRKVSRIPWLPQPIESLVCCHRLHSALPSVDLMDGLLRWPVGVPCAQAAGLAHASRVLRGALGSHKGRETQLSYMEAAASEVTSSEDTVIYLIQDREFNALILWQ